MWKVMEICYFGLDLFKCAQLCEYEFMLWLQFHQQQNKNSWNGNHIWCHFYFSFCDCIDPEWCWKWMDQEEKKLIHKLKKLELKSSEQQKLASIAK